MTSMPHFQKTRRARRDTATRRRRRRPDRARAMRRGSSTPSSPRPDTDAGVLRVATSVRERIREVDETLEHLRAAVDCCVDVAKGAEKATPGSASVLRPRIEALCELKREKLATMDALKALEREYGTSRSKQSEREDGDGDSFDFEAYLDRKTKYYMASRPKELEFVIEFDKAVEKARGGEGEDMVMEDDGADGLRNEKCPMTMRRIEDLDDPVEDNRGFVYERAAIVQYIGRAKSKECPVAGTQHTVTVAELKPSRMAKKMKQRAAGVGSIRAGEFVSP